MNHQTPHTIVQTYQPIPDYQIVQRNNIIRDLIKYADFIDAPPLNTAHENINQRQLYPNHPIK